MKNSFIIRIIAIFLFLLAVIAITMMFTACGVSTTDADGYRVGDYVLSFNRAVGMLPDGTIIEGKVDSWTDFDDSDQIQVTVDGDTYLFHSSNVVLIKERD